MNTPTRFRQVMQYQNVDHVPLLEEGFRDDVLERWARQGMPAQGPGELFCYDRRDNCVYGRMDAQLGASGLKSETETGKYPFRFCFWHSSATTSQET